MTASTRNISGQSAEHAKSAPGGLKGPLRALPNLHVTAITDNSESATHLVRMLQRLRCRVNHIWPAPEQVPLDTDVVFCELMDDLPQRLPWLPGEPRAALIVVVPHETTTDFELLHNCAPHAVLHYPVTSQTVLSALLVGRDHFLYERRLRGRIEKLDENLRTMRSVERAKAILMRKQNLTEEEAYKHLRRLAMEKRKTIGAVATAVVDTLELLG